jgi:hypothetical protein
MAAASARILLPGFRSRRWPQRVARKVGTDFRTKCVPKQKQGFTEVSSTRAKDAFPLDKWRMGVHSQAAVDVMLEASELWPVANLAAQVAGVAGRSEADSR